MVLGTIDIKKLLTSEQKAFYSQHKKFTIHALHYPLEEESVLVSFDKEIYEHSYFKNDFMDEFRIYFNIGFFNYIRQNRVKVIFLKNRDILVTNNFDLEVSEDISSLKGEYSHFFEKGAQKFEEYVAKTNLKRIYGKIFNDNLRDQLFTIAFKYRLFTDNFLNEDFFFNALKSFFPVRRALKRAFKANSISKEIEDRLILNYSIFLTYSKRYPDERSKRDPLFAYSFVEDHVSVRQYAFFFRLANKILFVHNCKKLIEKLVSAYDLNDVFNQLSFDIVRKVNMDDKMSYTLLTIISLTITALILDYHRKVKRMRLAELYNFDYVTVAYQMFSILKHYGYKTNSLSAYKKESVEMFKKFVSEDLKIDYNTLEINCKLIKELIEIILSVKMPQKFEPLLNHLLNRLELAKSRGLDVISKIPEEKKNELIILLLKILKTRQRLKLKDGLRFINLVEKVADNFNIKLNLEYLYKHGLFRTIYYGGERD